MATKLAPVKFRQSELSLETVKYVSRARKEGDLFVAQVKAKQHGSEFYVYLQYCDPEGLEVFDPFVSHPKQAVQERIMTMKYGRDITDCPEEWPGMVLEKLLKWGFRFFTEETKV